MKKLPKISSFFLSFFLALCTLHFALCTSALAESLTACPVEIYPCGTIGPEDNPFYPYPGSSCYRTTQSPKVVSNYNLSAQRTFQITVPISAACPDYSPLWNFTVGAEGNNLKIPVVRQVSELFEGESPYNRKKSLDENGPILEDYSPIDKLIPYSPKKDILKQIIAVSAIDSQYSRFAPPGINIPQGELADNPIHDYIIAYAIPANGRPADCSTDKNWWYGGEEFKNTAGARPIRASEPDCASLLLGGGLPKHSEAEKAGFRGQSLYAGVVCPKLYGQPFGALNGIYAQELKKSGKMLCPLSEDVRVRVWKEFMPVVSHETEPAEITLTFDSQPVGEGKIYLPHLARLAQLSEIFKETLNPKMEEPGLADIFSVENITVSSPNQELVCPVNADLAIPPAKGGQNAKVEVTEGDYDYGLLKIKTCTYRLTQEGNLKTEIPELLKIKENLVGDNGFFRAWLPKEIAQKIDEEVLGSDALEGEGKINIAASSGTSVSPSEISLKYPFLRSVERYYQEFLKMIFPEAHYGTNPLVTSPGKLTYSIPFKDTNISVSNSNKNCVVQYVAKNWKGTQISLYWNKVYEAAVNHGWNPAFVIALWIEESGANAVGNYGLGCTAGSFDIDSQLACLFRNYDSYANQDFKKFMCNYSEGHYPCETFTANPRFPNSIKYWYDQLTGSCTVNTE